MRPPVGALHQAMQVGWLPAATPGGRDGVDERPAEGTVDERGAFGMGWAPGQRSDQLVGGAGPNPR